MDNSLEIRDMDKGLSVVKVRILATSTSTTDGGLKGCGMEKGKK